MQTDDSWIAPGIQCNERMQLKFAKSTRTENPRVGGSIPPLATTSNLMIRMQFSGITRGLSASILARNGSTSGLSKIGSIVGPGDSAGLAIWEPGGSWRP